MTTDDSSELPDGRRTRWNEHNEARRQVIIDAAIAVLERQAPGEDFQVQAVADEANMSRTVVYRHFEDRTDLDRAVQRYICEVVGARLSPAVRTEGTAEEIIHAIIESFVSWATDHSTLYWFLERDLSGWAPSPLGQAMSVVAAQVESVMTIVMEFVGVELDEDERAALDPWVYGLISAIFAGVRRWMERDVREPAPDKFVDIITESTWLIVNGMALRRGVDASTLQMPELMKAFGTKKGHQ